MSFLPLNYSTRYCESWCSKSWAILLALCYTHYAYHNVTIVLEHEWMNPQTFLCCTCIMNCVFLPRGFIFTTRHFAWTLSVDWSNLWSFASSGQENVHDMKTGKLTIRQLERTSHLVARSSLVVLQTRCWIVETYLYCRKFSLEVPKFTANIWRMPVGVMSFQTKLENGDLLPKRGGNMDWTKSIIELAIWFLWVLHVSFTGKVRRIANGEWYPFYLCRLETKLKFPSALSRHKDHQVSRPPTSPHFPAKSEWTLSYFVSKPQKKLREEEVREYYSLISCFEKLLQHLQAHFFDSITSFTAHLPLLISKHDDNSSNACSHEYWYCNNNASSFLEAGGSNRPSDRTRHWGSCLHTCQAKVSQVTSRIYRCKSKDGIHGLSHSLITTACQEDWPQDQHITTSLLPATSYATTTHAAHSEGWRNLFAQEVMDVVSVFISTFVWLKTIFEYMYNTKKW